MRYISFCVLFFCALFCQAEEAVNNSADELTNILSGVYKPKLMSEGEQDSILQLSVLTSQQPTVNSQQSETSDPRWRLEYENKRPIYRHSFEADWYVVDTKKNTRTQIGGGPVRDAKMSPNGRYVVYSKENNLYIFKLDYMTEVPITTHNGERTMAGTNGVYKEWTVYNGISDWLYEEEFGITSLFEFSPDSKQIAFVRLSEAEVPLFTWMEYLDENYPVTKSIRYPRAGERNPQASVFVYDIYYKNTHVMTLDTEDCYIPRLKWTTPVLDAKNPVESKLIVEKINHDQNKMEVYAINPKSTMSWLLYKESSEKYYVDYELFDHWYWLKDNSFVALSEKDGWRSLYLFSAQGQEVKRLTPDGIDVTCVYGIDEKEEFVYYQAAPTPLTRQCYSCELKRGNISQLTNQDGIHSLRFAKNWLFAIENFESSETPNVYWLYEVRRGALKPLRELKNNDELSARWHNSELPEKTFLTFVTTRRDTVHAWMILPPDLQGEVDSVVKHPCIIMQYSGPASQRVLNRWRKGFGHYLASQGYVVINSDGRGTDCRGRAWRNETYMMLGEKEADDQISTAEFAASLAFVDPERIAIVGWSYGGYQAIRTLCEKDSPYKCAVAIAPVTDWRMYDSGYTERFMRRPQVNEKGYRKADVTQMADRMNGKLLLVHSLADDNVHVQHTFKYAEALVEAGKQFEMQIYPDDNHFLRKRSNYEHLHRRIMIFLQNNL